MSNQAHKNRIKGLKEMMGYRKVKAESISVAKRKNLSPATNPAGKAKFEPKPQVGPFRYIPGAKPSPDKSHAARLRGARSRKAKSR